MKCAPAARRTSLSDMPSPDFYIKFSVSFHVNATPLPVKSSPGGKDLSISSSVLSRDTSHGLWRQRRLKISVQRNARLVAPAPVITEGLVDRLILVGGIWRRLAAWRIRPEAQVLQCPPDPPGPRR